MNTEQNLYIDYTPCDLFRSGNAHFSRLDHVRTSPPRKEGETIDIEVFQEKDTSYWVKAGTGGISVFTNPILSRGKYWYKIKAGTYIPDGLQIIRDKKPEEDEKRSLPDEPVHYTICPLYDMLRSRYVYLLSKLADAADPIF
jgi:hypothetical protein